MPIYRMESSNGFYEYFANKRLALKAAKAYGHTLNTKFTIVPVVPKEEVPAHVLNPYKSSLLEKKLANLPTEPKACSKCGVVRKINMFHNVGSYYRNTCKVCVSEEYHRKKQEKAKANEQ